MTALIRASEQSPLQRILESAVVLSWADLMPSAAGCIQIEYHTSGTNHLDYLKLWASSTTRGNWLLICEAGVSNSYAPRKLAFSNGFNSGFLSRSLEFVLANQTRFPDSFESLTDLILVHSPRDPDIARATQCMKEAYESSRRDHAAERS